MVVAAHKPTEGLEKRAREMAEALGHELKPFSSYDSLRAASCTRCNMSAIVDIDTVSYPVTIEGPAIKYPCSAR